MSASLAFVFPGQGAVYAGMGVDLLEGNEAARRAFDTVSIAAGTNVGDICRTKLLATLVRTDRAHMVTYAHSLAVLAVLSEAGLAPSRVAGHSLGELAAVTASGALSPEDGSRLVVARGRLMAEACRRHEGGMISVQGLDFESATAFAGSFDGGNEVCVAGMNGRREAVLSGRREAIGGAWRRLREMGLQAVPLKVDGAFHSPLMAKAAAAFEDVLRSVEFKDPRVPVVSSATGEVLTTSAAIREALGRQIFSPCRWDRVLEVLQNETGVWIEVGPGHTLTGLALRWNRRTRVLSTSTLQRVRAVVSEMNGGPRA